MKDQHSIQLLYYVITLVSFWGLEAFDQKNQIKTKLRHSGINFSFIFTALPIQLVMIGLILSISAWANRCHWGLIFIIPYHENPFVYLIVLFLLLDLGEYCYHVIMHKVSGLWKFHLVHHSDQQVDVSTTTREHPGETFVRTGFLMLWVFLFGPNALVLVLRQSAQTIINISSHTQFRLPQKINKIVALVFITPNLHHVHHHYLLPYTDKNYGDVLSIWDRLFGTYAELPASETQFGLDTHMDPAQTGHFWNIFKMPFISFSKKQAHK